MLTTRQSLIRRVRDSNDREAWSAFVDIYGPLIYRFGLRRGLQDADAADLAQDVLGEVACCIDRFNYDAEMGRFRNWLLVIARYKLSHQVRKNGRQKGTGDTTVLKLLEQQVGPNELDQHWEKEYQVHLFRWATEQVRSEVSERSWRVFWFTAVKGKSGAEVASKLGMEIGAVYVAKSRVLLRIREMISSIDEAAV